MLKLKQSKKVREIILELLEKPQTATDLLEKMPHISSTGTVAYHLQKLTKEGIIVREERKNVRGKPVYYYLACLKKQGLESWEELREKQKKEKKKKEIEILKEIKRSPAPAEELMSKHVKNFNMDELTDIIYNNEDHIELLAKITNKGRIFLRENSK